MALVVKDRVKETTTTTGTGTINLAGAASGFQSFVSGVGDGNTTYYAITDANGAWEVGLGTVTDGSPDTLARTTVLATSNGDTSAITLSSGTHTVFSTYPAGKAVYLDASGNLSYTVDISSDTNLAVTAPIVLTDDTLSLSASLNNLTDVTIVGTDNLFIEVDGAAPSNSITSGESNIGIGRNALSNVSSGHYNIGIGENALLAQGAGHSRSIAIGNNAMRYAAANYCVAIGHEALQGDSSSNSSSQFNTAIGYLTLKDATTGDLNVALGHAAGTDLTSGSNNIFIGPNAGYVHTTGSNTLYIAYATEASDGTIIKADMAEKHLAIGMADDLFSNSAGDGTLQIYPKDAADEAIFVKMPTSHSANLIQIQNSSGTDLFVVDSTGEITTGSISGGGGGSGDITGVDLTGGVGISIDSETNTTSGSYSSTITCNLEGTELASTGETGTSKFLRVDGDGTCSWQVPPDTDTTYTKASFDLDHLFVLVGASADTDENLGTFTGSTISDSRTIKQALQDLETELETKTTNTGDITGVDLTGGTGISIDSETNTASGSYSSTITCNLEGTELASTGETGTAKFLRVDGDGTCSWQVPPDTDTTYTKASFDLDHLFVLVGASADTDENLGTFTGSTISDSRTVKQALQDLETELETKTSNAGDITGVDLTGGVGISIDSETNTGSGSYSSTITCNLEGTELASTGETGTSKFLRVDGDGTCSWQVPPDTNTTYVKADFDLDHLFTLVGASADSDEHLGTFTGSTISDNQTIKAAIQALETAVETKGAGDITGVDLTGGTGISIDSETNTGSGAYSSTITCNLEGTELASTGETGTAKFLRVDGDGTCSWQVPPDTNTTYAKADFDLDHLFTLVGASADTDENLGTFTGSTISDSRTIKQALQDLETELETKTSNTGDITGVDLTGGTGISIDSETNTGSGAYSSTITCNLEGTELASTGETGTTKFLRVDGDGTCSWQVPPDTNTTYSGGTNLTLDGTTFNVDDAFLKNNADDTTSGTVTMANLIIGDGGNIGSASDTDAVAISAGGVVTLATALKTTLKSNTDASTVTFDLNVANTHTVTLGDNRTLAISNETAGQKFIINLVQDGTGSRTVTWFSTIKWAGGSAPTLTTTANKADSFGFLCTGTDAYYGFVIGQNI